MVEPVVVSPDIVSKNARVKVSRGMQKSSGSVAEAGMQQPAERHQQEAVARLELPAMPVRRRRERSADGGRDRGREEKRAARDHRR